MTITEFDAVFERIAERERLIEHLRRQNEKAEEECYQRAGVEWRDRGPGYRGWSIIGVMGNFDTPRQAMVAALEKEQQEKP